MPSSELRCHPDWKTWWEAEQGRKGLSRNEFSGGRGEGSSLPIHTILDEDLGAGETAVDGSHVQRTFAFFALWKHGVFCCFSSFLFSVQSIENALFPLSKDTSLRMVQSYDTFSAHILTGPWQALNSPGSKWTVPRELSRGRYGQDPRARLLSPLVSASSLQVPGS